MEEEIYEDETCEKDVIRPYLSKRPDVLTEEGKKEFFEKAKNQTIENYKDELRSKTEDELTDKAMEEAAKELGISLDELMNPRGRRRNPFVTLGERDNKPKYTEEQVNFYRERIISIQKRQNEIIELLSNKEKHLIMDKNHTRNAVVTEYLHIETLKCRFLDILSAAYIGKAGCQDTVDYEGSSFTKRLGD